MSEKAVTDEEIMLPASVSAPEMIDALTQACTARDSGDHTEALEQLVEARRRFPECTRAAYLLGTFLLDAGDKAGLDHLKFAMAQDEAVTGAVCARAIAFLRTLGDDRAVVGYENKLKSWSESVDHALLVQSESASGR